jgi:Glutaredoxin-like domain (DUF836)
LAAIRANAKLFSTAFCHLCEEAEEILHQAGITAVKLDIIDDEKLFERYSWRIPVLMRVDNNAELDWPFDVATVFQFLK